MYTKPKSTDGKDQTSNPHGPIETPPNSTATPPVERPAVIPPTDQK